MTKAKLWITIISFHNDFSFSRSSFLLCCFLSLFFLFDYSPREFSSQTLAPLLQAIPQELLLIINMNIFCSIQYISCSSNAKLIFSQIERQKSTAREYIQNFFSKWGGKEKQFAVRTYILFLFCLWMNKLDYKLKQPNTA